MRQKGVKKFLIGLGIGIMLTFGFSASAFAATGAILEQPETQELFSPEIAENDHVAAASYLGYTTDINQIAATTTSISLRWNAVSEASGYKVLIGDFKADSGYKDLGTISKTECKITNLKPGTAYTVRIYAVNTNEVSERYSSIDCTTLYNKLSVSSCSGTGSSYTIKMKAPSVSNAITGYRAVYTSYSTKKTVTKDYPVNRYSHHFTITGLKNNTFYKIEIKPYIILNGKKFVGPTGTTRYFALQPSLIKNGNTSSTMSVKWNKTAGATSYTIYIKYPGSSSYKKVKTTTGTTFTLTGMKTGYNYQIKIIANKKVGSKTWKSPSNQYYVMRLYRY